MNVIKMSVFILLPFVGLFSLDNMKSDAYSKYAAKETVVQISLDTIKPGPITIKQLLSVKELKVISPGKNGKDINRKVISFGLAIISLNSKTTTASLTQTIDFIGSKLSIPASSAFAEAQPGDNFWISKLVIDGVEKYKPLIQPDWTIVSEKKHK